MYACVWPSSTTNPQYDGMCMSFAVRLEVGNIYSSISAQVQEPECGSRTPETRPRSIASVRPP